MVHPDLILKYSESISKNAAYAFGGRVNTTSNDSIFEKYLNHPNRGVNQYKNNQNINYQNLIFNNCMIKKLIRTRKDITMLLSLINKTISMFYVIATLILCYFILFKIP